MAFIIEIQNHRLRFAKTLVLYYAALAVGLGVGIIGPTLLDLSILIQENIDRLSYVLPGRGGGHAIGSLLGQLIWN